MRLSTLGSRQIINLHDGSRMGMLGETELTIDPQTGEIDELVIPARSGFWQQRRASVIPWSAVRRIGPEVMIVDLDTPLALRR